MKQTALITGASKRIGKAISIHLASLGWNIALHYNSSAKSAKQLKQELGKQFPKSQFVIFQANLMDETQVQQLLPEVLTNFPSIDLLINNASIFEPSELKKTTYDLLQQQMMVNFQAPFLLCRDFANSSQKGLIINIVDTRITTNEPNYSAYSLSKKTLWELTKMAALEFAPHVRVNAIAPGITLPPEGKNEAYLLALAKKTPLKSPGGIDSILQSIDYIIKNKQLTGQLLFCNSGEHLGLKL